MKTYHRAERMQYECSKQTANKETKFLHINVTCRTHCNLLDLEGDPLGHPHTDGGPQDTVPTDLPLSTVLNHSSKET